MGSSLLEVHFMGLGFRVTPWFLVEDRGMDPYDSRALKVHFMGFMGLGFRVIGFRVSWPLWFFEFWYFLGLSLVCTII